MSDAITPIVTVGPETVGKPKRRPVPKHLPGHIAGRYRVLSLLGRGGTGEVVEAYDLLEDRLVALKILKRESARNSALLGRFLREARAMGRIDHPGIVRVYDTGVDKSGLYFLVMDIVQGVSLSQHIAEHGRMSALAVAQLAAEVCEVMQVAHNMKVHHRDLKPSNLLMPHGWFEGQGQISVVDFGTAKIASNTASVYTRKLTGQNELIGTPQYMPPEQASNKGTDERSDLYSLGCIMYQALSGHLPFDGPNHFSIIVGHMERSPVALDQLVGPEEAPPALSDFVARLMAKNPADRPINAAAAEAEIRQLMDILPATISGRDIPTPAEFRANRPIPGLPSVMNAPDHIAATAAAISVEFPQDLEDLEDAATRPAMNLDFPAPSSPSFTQPELSLAEPPQPTAALVAPDEMELGPMDATVPATKRNLFTEPTLIKQSLNEVLEHAEIPSLDIPSYDPASHDAPSLDGLPVGAAAPEPGPLTPPAAPSQPRARTYIAPPAPADPLETLAQDKRFSLPLAGILGVIGISALGVAAGVAVYVGYNTWSKAPATAPVAVDADKKAPSEPKPASNAQNEDDKGAGDTADDNDAKKADAADDKQERKDAVEPVPDGNGRTRVSFDVAPKGASIWRGGAEIGKAPLEVALDKETRWPVVFLLTHPKARSQYVVIQKEDVEDNAVSIQEKLPKGRKGMARLEMLTEPSGAEVQEDGALIGFTPVHLVRPVAHGKLTLTVLYDDGTSRPVVVGLTGEDTILKVPADRDADPIPELKPKKKRP